MHASTHLQHQYGTQSPILIEPMNTCDTHLHGHLMLAKMVDLPIEFTKSLHNCTASLLNFSFQLAQGFSKFHHTYMILYIRRIYRMPNLMPTNLPNLMQTNLPNLKMPCHLMPTNLPNLLQQMVNQLLLLVVVVVNQLHLMLPNLLQQMVNQLLDFMHQTIRAKLQIIMLKILH